METREERKCKEVVKGGGKRCREMEKGEGEGRGDTQHSDGY